MAADGPNHRGYIARSAATARCRTATSCALSGAHSSTRPVRGELGSAPRPAAGEHERSPMLVTLRSEENVNILSEPLVQLANEVLQSPMSNCALSYYPVGFSREIMNGFSALQGPYWI